MRRALQANIAAAGGTLASLARLVTSLPTLAMPDLVGDQVRLGV
jgi:Phosphatidylinositol-glycan biosynthesis class S protein